MQGATHSTGLKKRSVEDVSGAGGIDDLRCDVRRDMEVPVR